MEHGTDKLPERLAEFDIAEVINVNRVNGCEKK